MGISQWIGSLLRLRPPFSNEELLETPLKRCLSLHHLIFYSVANMAGAGIYVLTGRLIRNEAGAAACISYMIAAISSVFTGLCYAELATLIPKAGSVYVYTFLTLGELPAFIIGWTSISDVIVGIASISKAFSGTVDELCSRVIYNWTVLTFGALGQENVGIWSPSLDFLAFGLIILMIIITATGAKASLTFNMIMTIGQIICLCAMAIGGYVYGSSKSWSAEHGGFAPNGAMGIVSGATIAVFAFSGFDSIANASEETKDPKKTIPRALFWSIVVISALYFLASLGLAHLVPREFIDYTSPFVSGFHRLGIQWMVWVSAIGTLLATGAGKVTSMFIVPRMIYSIASDGLIFQSLKDVNRGTQVPIKALVCGGAVAAVLALLLNIQTLAEFMSLGILFSYFTIGINIIVIRYLMTDDETKTAVYGFQDSKIDEKGAISNSGKSTCQMVDMRFRSISHRFSFIAKKQFFILLIMILTLTSFSTIVILENGIKYKSCFFISVAIILSVVWLATVLMLCTYKPTVNTDSYQTPLMPMAPVMTIFINSILIARLPLLTWARFAVWMVVGLSIYFFYGRSHSIANLENQRLKSEESKNDASQQKEDYGALAD